LPYSGPHPAGWASSLSGTECRTPSPKVAPGDIVLLPSRWGDRRSYGASRG
jgi:hypothetical protein